MCRKRIMLDGADDGKRLSGKDLGALPNARRAAAHRAAAGACVVPHAASRREPSSRACMRAACPTKTSAVSIQTITHAGGDFLHGTIKAAGSVEASFNVLLVEQVLRAHGNPEALPVVMDRGVHQGEVVHLEGICGIAEDIQPGLALLLSEVLE